MSFPARRVRMGRQPDDRTERSTPMGRLVLYMSTPGPDRAGRANVTAFTRWLARERGRDFGDYQALWRWSVTDLDGFWQAVWDYCGVEASARPAAVLGARTMPGADWFPGARLNYAQHVLRRERPGQDALHHQSETAPLAGLPSPDLAHGVPVLST